MAMIIPMSPGSKPGTSAPAPQPSQTDLLMALAQMHKDGRFDGDPEMPFLKGLQPGQRGTPADLTQTGKDHGDYDARGVLKRAMKLDNPNMSDKDFESALEEQPGS